MSLVLDLEKPRSCGKYKKQPLPQEARWHISEGILPPFPSHTVSNRKQFQAQSSHRPAGASDTPQQNAAAEQEKTLLSFRIPDKADRKTKPSGKTAQTMSEHSKHTHKRQLPLSSIV